ncbi:aminotransferase class I/II-fold pyridoxal phosphate-dependent enzyme [Piscirickettsia litoralis]|uniref:Aminotransferase class I and II family protein n=1 Tax=Piscirickettsia litoralis TaxID=1891921 RepID=A0ABX3A180_9GAMM|nr:8-amino-7-oxononanoate synthase [Piscirickettsia litoralis]ODN42626.1 aminotransferase class I and II family protein [Piscirickettsia litoralis]
MALDAELDLQLAVHKEKRRLRVRQSMVQLEHASCQIDNKHYVNFASNDYLGLSQHDALKRAATRAINQYGVGSGSSAQVSGFHPEHEALQEEFAEWLGVDAVLLYSSGYLANVGALTALLSRKQLVVHDKDNHASLLDGSLQAHARIQRFAHNNMLELARLLEKAKARHLWVVSEALFSMDGYTVPINALVEIIKQFQLNLLLDETHSLGIIGSKGQGLIQAYARDVNLEKMPEDYLLTAGLGKAFGVMGGVVAGSRNLIDYLTQFSRSAIYTTAQPPALAAAARASLALIRAEQGDELRGKLKENIGLFHRYCNQLGVIYHQGSRSPIQAIILKTEQGVLDWQQALKKHGFWVAVMRPPSVAEGASRLRITITAAHRKADIQGLVEVLARLQELKS